MNCHHAFQWRTFTQFILLLLVSLNTGCSGNKPAEVSTTNAPSPSSSTQTPEMSECEQAANDTQLSTELALQKCIDSYHALVNLTAFFPAVQDGGKVEALGNNKFAVTLRYQDYLQATVGEIDPTITQTPDVQIYNSISSLASKCEELFTLFEKRGLQRIAASLLTYGLKGEAAELLTESYRVEVLPVHVPKIQAWLKDESITEVGIASSPTLNAMWTVKVNQYKDYRYEKGP
jgi:hypothetical protein